MSYYDSTSAFAPSKRRALNEAAITEHYLLHNEPQRRRIMETYHELERLLKDYASVLSLTDRGNVNALNSKIQEAYQYRESFMCYLCMCSYRVFDETHRKYPKILELIAEHDPQYLDYAVSAHEHKIKQCKGPIFEI